MQTKLGEGGPDIDGFFKQCQQIGQQCLEIENPLIVHHLDCDGLSSAGLVAYALKSQGKPFTTKLMKRVDENALKQLPSDRPLIFTDIGSGQIELVEKLANKKIVIDHHPPSKKTEVPTANCHDFDFDGATDASAATVAYFCFKHLNQPRLAELGIVGAVGDMQDKNGFISLNKIMLDDAIKQELVLKRKDLRIFGRVSRPLIWFLTYCTEPILPGLTGNEKACALFLEKNNIPLKKGEEWMRYYDLDVFDRQRLVSAIINYGAEKLGEEPIKEIIGDVYLFLKEPEGTELRDAYEFSTLMNACGRHDAPEAAIAVCLDEPDALQKAREYLHLHRKMIQEGLYFAKKSVNDFGAFYFLDGRKKISDTVIGTVAGSFYSSGIIKPDKPVIAFSEDEEGKVKVSGRATKKLVELGLDLGEVMRKAGAEVQGLGGGHNIAAGCSFVQTPENIDKFLRKAKEVIRIQLPTA